ncbi:restriction endonuclease [Candidatus Parcubacteria bacterium]|nr:restriction endonuclease [Candidatus Parcubacteria bacterium]
MSKKRNKILEDIINFIGLILAFMLFVFWISDKTKFYLLFGALVIATFVMTFIFIKQKRGRFNSIHQWNSNRDLLLRVRSMHPNEFEEYIADLYRRLGYKTEKVGGSHDGGIDVIAKKDGMKHYIQCKKHITSRAGVSDVREFAGALIDKLANDEGIFITTNIFTPEAKQYAKDKPIKLIDSNALLRLIKQTGKNKDEITINEDFGKCPKCGGELAEKNGRYGKFLGCSNYPKCGYAKNINNK